MPLRRLLTLTANIIALAALWPAGASASTLILQYSDDGKVAPGYDLIAQGFISTVPASSCPGGTGDTIFNVGADAYIVPSGTEGPLMALGNLKTSIYADTGTNYFSDEYLGPAPSGYGAYDIVFDECQDGHYDPGIDGVAGQFEVVRGTGNEILGTLESLAHRTAVSERAAMMADNTEAVLHGFKVLVAFMDAWHTAEVDATLLTACGINKWSSQLMPYLIDPSCDFLFSYAYVANGLFALHTVEAIFGNDPGKMLETLTNQANAEHRKALDPPDPNYALPSSVVQKPSLPPSSSNAMDVALARVSNNAQLDAELNGAFVDAMERYEGAFSLGSAEWAYEHLHEIAELSQRLSGLYETAATDIEGLKSALSANTTDYEQLRSVNDAMREYLRANASDSTVQAGFATQGITSEELNTVAAQSPWPTETEILSDLDQYKQALLDSSDTAAAFARDAKQMLANASVNDPMPWITLGGPYTANVGGSLHFNVTATAAPESEIVAYGWDFDGDGIFTDATGSSATYTPSTGGLHLIGVRATDDQGRSAVSYAWAEVTETNHAPQLSGQSHDFTVTAGTSSAFEATASDSDGDSVVLKWYVDGTLSGQGEAFDYSPSAETRGIHRIEVVASDGHPNGHSRAAWVVGVAAPLKPSFSYSPDSPVAGSPIQFTDGSTDSAGLITGWQWNFGDGNESNTANPSHIFEEPGTYSVQLTATDDQGNTESTIRSVDVGDPRITVSFSHDPEVIAVGQPVSFTDHSTDLAGTITSWHWNFGDGGTSVEQNPSHTYSTAGSYTVKLTVTDSNGVSTFASHLVSVLNNLTSAFSYAPSSPTAGSQVQFTDGSTPSDGPITTWSWHFGDGQTSTQQSPKHGYAAAGTYSVTLTVRDAAGREDSFTENVAVSPATTTIPRFEYSPTDIAAGQDVHFTSTTIVGPSPVQVIYWTFGDGSLRDGGNNATHRFVASGNYMVTMRVIDWDEQIFDISQTVVVKPGIVASFSSTPEAPAPGQAVSFTDRSIAELGSIVDWKWDFGDGDSSHARNASHAYSEPGLHTVALTVTGDDGSTNTTQNQVHVVAAPTVNFSILPARTEVGQAASFFDDSSPSGSYELVSWHWDFGDGTSSGTRDTSHAYANVGTYTVTLRVTDTRGVVGTASKTFEVAGPPTPHDLSLTTKVGMPDDLQLSADGGASDLNYEVIAQPNHGTLSGTPPNLRYTPAEGFIGNDSFAYTVSSSPFYDSIVRRDQPLAFWRLNETSGPIAHDASGHGNDLTYGSGVAFGQPGATGDGDASVAFEAGSYASGPLLTRQRDNMSFEAWVYWIGGPGSSGIFYNGHSGYDGYGLWISAGWGSTCGIGTDARILLGGVDCDATNGGVPIPKNTWVHLTAVESGAGNWKIYGNGKLLHSGYSLGRAPALGTTFIGMGSASLRIDDVAIYDHPLAPEEILSHYQTGQESHASARVSITVEAPNHPPTPTNDSLRTDENSPLAIDSATLLANDSDPDGDVLSLESASATADTHGTIAVGGNKVIYTPESGYSGPASFEYVISDGRGGTAKATVSIAVDHVNRPPTVDLPSSTTIAEGSTLALAPIAFDADGDALSYSWTTDSGTNTPSLVGETAVFSADDGPTVAHVTVTVSDGTLSSSATETVTVRNIAPTVSVGPDATIVWGLPVDLSSSADDPSVIDTQVGFDFAWNLGDGASASGSRVDHAYAEPGSFTATASVTDKDGGTGSASLNVTVTKHPTNLTYVGPTTVFNESATLSAKLKDESGTDTAKPSGRSVLFSITGETLTGTTDESGVATVTTQLPASALGPQAVSVSFAEDDLYLASSAEANLTLFGLPATGSFAIGDQHAAGSVTFWGAQWAKKNPMSGGSAPSSFKGFVNRPGLPVCGAPWSTDPGNSSDPPNSVPSYMGVIVADSITKSGSTISGNSKHIVVVKPDSGYGPSPGHAGTGTIVASVC